MDATTRRRIVMLGSPEVAVRAAECVVAAGHEIIAVVSRPDARRGRGGALSPTPLKAWAEATGTPVFDDPETMVDAVGAGAVLGVVVAYGRLISPRVLERIPMINIHFSLLPRWRGAAPVERCLLAGDARSGVCIMHLEETLDTGAVLARREVEVSATDTTASLAGRLGDLGAELLVEVLAGEIGPGVPQSGTPTYASKITAQERLVDWADSARHIERRIRALAPSTHLGALRIKILEAHADSEQVPGPPGTLGHDGSVACGEGSLHLHVVQPAGRAPMSAQQWLAGVRRDAVLRFGSLP